MTVEPKISDLDKDAVSIDRIISEASTREGINLAELAARLGSINTVDRKGEVLWMDDFEGSKLKWSKVTTAAGSEVALTAFTARSGSQSVRLLQPTSAGSTVIVYADLPLLTTGKLGVEYHVAAWSVPRNYYSVIALDDGSYSYQGYLRHNLLNSTLEIYDSSGTWVELLFEKYVTSPYLFHVFKLVVDPVTNKYDRVLFRDHEIDVSQYSLYKGTTVGAPLFTFNFYVTSGGAARHKVYLDDFIFTHNEP